MSAHYKTAWINRDDCWLANKTNQVLIPELASDCDGADTRGPATVEKSSCRLFASRTNGGRISGATSEGGKKDEGGKRTYCKPCPSGRGLFLGCGSCYKIVYISPIVATILGERIHT